MLGFSPIASAPLASVGETIVFPNSVFAVGAIEPVTVVGNAVIEHATGVAGEGVVAAVTVVTGQGLIVSPEGVVADNTLGNVTISGTANIVAAGVADDVALGSVTVNINSRIIPTPVKAFSQLGEVEVKINAPVSVTGLSTNGAVGQLLVWQQIDDSQTPPDPNWVSVN